jgi:hypothetical protein
MDVSIIAAWNIWKQRNNLKFENKQTRLSSWKHQFVEDAALQAQGSSSVHFFSNVEAQTHHKVLY